MIKSSDPAFFRIARSWQMALGLLVVFIIFTFLVYLDLFNRVDLWITLWLQTIIPQSLILPFSLISLFGMFEFTLIICLVLAGVLFLRGYYLTSVLSLMTFPALALIELLGKSLIDHPAPPQYFDIGIKWFSLPSHQVSLILDYSYPSGHASRMSFLITFISYLLFYHPQILGLKLSHKAKKVVFILAGLSLFFIIVSRINLGAHWFSDVVGGCLLGSSFGLLSATTLHFRTKLSTLLSLLKLPSR